MSPHARPSTTSLVLAGNILEAHRLLPGLAYTLGTVQIARALEPQSPRLIRSIPEFYLAVGAGAEPPEEFNMALVLAAVECIRNRDQGDNTHVTHMHEALMLGALEHYLKINCVGWTPEGDILQGLTDEEEADFMAFYHYAGELLGVPGEQMEGSSVDLRTRYDARMLVWGETGQVIDRAGARMFWDLVLDTGLATELDMTADQILSAVGDGMYSNDAAVMGEVLEERLD